MSFSHEWNHSLSLQNAFCIKMDAPCIANQAFVVSKAVTFQDSLMNSKLSSSALNLRYTTYPNTDPANVVTNHTPIKAQSLPDSQPQSEDSRSISYLETPRYPPPTPLIPSSLEPSRVSKTTATPHVGSYKRRPLQRGECC